jgi:hypothetical protein
MNAQGKNLALLCLGKSEENSNVELIIDSLD